MAGFDLHWGRGIGLQGDSYAIPTKDGNLNVLSLDVIKQHVDDFVGFAKDNPKLTFKIVAIGCGLAGYAPEDIAPLFRDTPANCILPIEFQEAA